MSEGEKGIIDRILTAKKSNPFVQNELKGKLPVISESAEVTPSISETTQSSVPSYNPEAYMTMIEGDDEVPETASHFSVPKPLSERKGSITKVAHKSNVTKKSILTDSKVIGGKKSMKTTKPRIKTFKSDVDEGIVTVDTVKYKAVHGREPRGDYGMWMFKIGGDEVSFTGTYARAKQLAIEYAKKVHVYTVYVLG